MSRSLAAGLIGGTTALLFVLDPSVEWTGTTAFPVFALAVAIAAVVANATMLQSWSLPLAAAAALVAAAWPVASLVRRPARTLATMF
jgi:hypothetical protein